MPDSILVVEYEPRYIERVRQALSGHSQPNFAKDGEEAVKMLESGSARLIVLSSIIPKISTSELIRKIRAMPHHQLTPILITVSGYNGKSPKADAVKLGAIDILPKPYSEGEFLNRVKQLLESPASVAPEATIQIPKMSPSDFPPPEPTIQVAKMTPEELAKAAKVSSSDIFGDLVDDGAKKQAAKSKSSAELDKLLETTLSGLQGTPKRAASAPKPDAKKSSAELDKLLETTLSGLDISRPRATPERSAPPVEGEAPKPVAAEPAPPPPIEKPPEPVLPEHTEMMPIPTAEELEAERKRSEAASRPAPPAPAPPPPAPPAPAPQAPAPPAPAPPPPAIPEGSVSLVSPVLTDASVEDEDEDEVTDGIRFGSYVLQEKIATGGMAEVWKARMRGVEGFQKIVAIKKILPHMSDNEEFLSMFVDEAKLAAQLSHNNIIHIYELGKIGDSYFIAMEYVDGEDLKGIIKRGAETMQPMSIELAVFVASKIASALDYAHRKRGFDEKELGLVHRDVSPQNVLISYEGDIKLCDFGIAKAASKASHTMAGALKGKLQYMSPEQAWGRHIDKRSDIFALATVLFEMLTSQKLFKGDSELSVLEQVREARVQAPSSINDEVTPEVDAIVIKALAKDPAQRYQTAGEMARDLEQVLYSYRPAPTSADLAIHMHRLFVEVPPVVHTTHVHEEPSGPEPEPEAFSPEPVALVPPEPEPEPEPEPVPVSEPVVPVPVPEPVRHAEPAMASAAPGFEAEEEKKFPLVPVAIAAIVLIAAIGSGAFFMMGKKSESAATTAQANTSSTVPAPSTDTVDQLATDTTATDLVDPEATVTDTALDQALIDQEVQRRLDLERSRLEAQRQQEIKKNEEAARPQPQEAPPPKQPDRPVAQPEPVAPPPTETAQAQAPVPAPVIPPPAEPKPQPAVKVYKEGDLVPVGTPGLVNAVLESFSKPVYPPVAKLQRVEGIVIVQALISETGEVLEAKVLRGVSQDVGINEAALDAIKKSTFKPATINGVKVKSHYTRTISFKL